MKEQLSSQPVYAPIRTDALTAPLLPSSRILFIGHTPPPWDQWERRKRSANISHSRSQTAFQGLERMLQSQEFIDGAMQLGLQLAPSSDVQTDFLNLIPVVCRTFEDARRRNGPVISFMRDAHAKAENCCLLLDTILTGGHELIIIGWGRLRGGKMELAKPVMKALRASAASRTIIYRSVGHDHPSPFHRYAGHPAYKDERGRLAVPLGKFKRCGYG